MRKKESPNNSPKPLNTADKKLLRRFLGIFSAPDFKPYTRELAGKEIGGLPYRDTVVSFLEQIQARDIGITNYWLKDMVLRDLFHHPEKMKVADEIAIRKFFHGIIRGERFCDGLVGETLENGSMVVALKRLLEVT
jgi:hypothetical protein